LQFGYLGLHGGKCLFNFGFAEARDDMGRAIHVPGLDGEKYGALGPRFVALVKQPFNKCGIVLDDTRAAPKFDALAPRRVEQKQKGAVVFGKVGKRNVLPVAPVIGKAKRFLVDDLDKALRSAAMLDIGRAVRRRRGKEGGIQFGNKFRELRAVTRSGKPSARRRS